MAELSVLADLVLILGIAVGVVALLRRVGVPSIAGFILAGSLVGPRAAGLVQDPHEVEVLAEVGVVLLLYGIGLELSLQRLRRLWRPILQGGALQVGLTMAAATGAALGLGIPPGPALFTGCLVAVSSTAIVLRGLEARGEVDAPHGRLTLGILVFQDLCVVPMMLAIPLLAGGGTRGLDLVLALLKAAGILSGVVVAARLVVPRGLHLVAQTRQRDLFVLSVLLVCLGTAWIASLAGVSLALGAFLGGLVVAGSEYRHQALSDLIPLREVLTSIFFVSVGMLLDPVVLWTQRGPVLLLVGSILLGKFALVFVVGLIMRLPLRICILAGAALAQVGEFAFVLTRAAEGTALVQPHAAVLTAASILTMLVTPLAIVAGPHIAAGMGRLRALTRLLQVSPAVDAAQRAHRPAGHLILAGYGVAGQELARSLRHCGQVPYLVVDLNPENVRHASKSGDPAFFGDIASPEVLHALNAEEALELVIVINDPRAALRAVRAARAAVPGLHIVVRTRYLADAPGLRRAGARQVVVEELEAALKIAGDVLDRHCVGPELIRDELSRIRSLHHGPEEGRPDPDGMPAQKL